MKISTSSYNFHFYQIHLYKLGGKPSQTSHLYINSSDLSPIIQNQVLLFIESEKKKRPKLKTSYIAFCAAVVLLLAEAQVSIAVTCSPTEQSSHVSAITSSSQPSQLYCNKIKEQKHLGRLFGRFG